MQLGWADGRTRHVTNILMPRTCAFGSLSQHCEVVLLLHFALFTNRSGAAGGASSYSCQTRDVRFSRLHLEAFACSCCCQNYVLATSDINRLLINLIKICIEDILQQRKWMDYNWIFLISGGVSFVFLLSKTRFERYFEIELFVFELNTMYC